MDIGIEDSLCYGCGDATECVSIRPHGMATERFCIDCLQGLRRCEVLGVRCENRARYDSGYCGIHDITENEGKGRRL